MNDWWKFDHDGPDDEPEPLPAKMQAHEKAALDAIRAIAAMAETQPDKALVIGGTLRKISTAAGARAQSIGLRSVTVKKGVR